MAGSILVSSPVVERFQSAPRPKREATAPRSHRLSDRLAAAGREQRDRVGLSERLRRAGSASLRRRAGGPPPRRPQRARARRLRRASARLRGVFVVASAGVTSSEGSCRRIACSSCCSAWPGSIPSSSTSFASCLAVDAQRLRLATGAVEREHAAGRAAVRATDASRSATRARRRAACVLAERELGIDPLLDRDRRGAPRGARSRPARRARSRSRRAHCRARARAPRRGAPPRPPRSPAAFARRPSSSKRSNRRDVDLLRLDLEHVAARTRDEQLGRLEQLSQPRHLMVEAVARRARRPLGPQLVDQPVARDDLVRVEQENREQSTLLRTADRDDPPALPDLERPEQAGTPSPLLSEDSNTALGGARERFGSRVLRSEPQRLRQSPRSRRRVSSHALPGNRKDTRCASSSSSHPSRPSWR